jgi:hypothetical protein
MVFAIAPNIPVVRGLLVNVQDLHGMPEVTVSQKCYYFVNKMSQIEIINVIPTWLRFATVSDLMAVEV